MVHDVSATRLDSQPIMNRHILICSAIILSCLVSNSRSQELHPGHPIHHDTDLVHDSSIAMNIAWDSIYVLEGRKALERGGLGSMGAEWTTPHQENEMIVSAWYAEGLSTDYTELQLGAAYAFSLDSIDATLGYTWLDWDNDDVSDHELNFEIGGNAFQLIDLTATMVYSVDVAGSFIQLIASKDFIREDTIFTPYVLLGINEGYVSDEHDGLNNLQLGIEASTPISDSIELTGYIAYTIALDEKPGESLDDIFWVGLGIGFGN